MRKHRQHYICKWRSKRVDIFVFLRWKEKSCVFFYKHYVFINKINVQLFTETFNLNQVYEVWWKETISIDQNNFEKKREEKKR